MFQCAYCKSNIETNSLFCDQCGKEIFLCETCKAPGEGSWCEEDGGKLITAREVVQSTSTNAAAVAKEAPPSFKTINTTPAVRTENTPEPKPFPQTFIPELRLINRNLNLSLEIVNGEVIGRTAGPYAAQLSQFPSISGKHAIFLFNSRDWLIKDVGSTNGTKYNKTNNAWHTTPKIVSNTSVILEDNSFILLANIEFAVQIESSMTTQRI